MSNWGTYSDIISAVSTAVGVAFGIYAYINWKSQVFNQKSLEVYFELLERLTEMYLAVRKEGMSGEQIGVARLAFSAIKNTIHQRAYLLDSKTRHLVHHAVEQGEYLLTCILSHTDTEKDAAHFYIATDEARLHLEELIEEGRYPFRVISNARRQKARKRTLEFLSRYKSRIKRKPPR